jgi:membrane peptidoglycan carboxypeptidase
VRTPGLSVVTTIGPAAQRSALTAVGAHGGRRAAAQEPKGVEAALVAADGVRARYGGGKGQRLERRRAAPHPAASTFKPIVLAGAITEGIDYQSRWDSSSARLFRGVTARHYEPR